MFWKVLSRSMAGRKEEGEERGAETAGQSPHGVWGRYMYPRPFRRIEIAGKQARFISSTATPSEPVTGSGPPCPPRPALPSVRPACARPSSDSRAETRYGPSRVCKFFGALGCKTSQTERSSLSEQSATTRLQSVPDGQNFTRRDGVSPTAHKLASSLVPSCRNHRK